MVNFSASSSDIFILKAFSISMKASSTSRESRPRSLEKDADSTRADSSTPNFSWIMVLTLAAMPDFLLVSVLIINFFIPRSAELTGNRNRKWKTKIARFYG